MEDVLTRSQSETACGSVLDTVSTATSTQSWSLDALGNWSSVTTNGTAQTRSYNGQNQLTAVSGATTPTYDHNGNMTKDQTGNTYTFDAWNRMATVSASGSSTEFYGYLAGGQRASISVSGSTTDYSYFNDAWQEVELDNNTGASGSTVMQDTYVWAPLSLVEAGLANINELVARDDSSSNRIYVQQDANWDVTALVGKVSGTWQVVERFSFSPYGVATVLNASWASTTDGYGWVYRYQAGKFDSTSGLYNFRNRDYSPTLGQWLEADPAGYVQGANLYEANLGAPISHVDPYGMTSGTGSEGDGNNTLPTGAGTQPTTSPTTQPTAAQLKQYIEGAANQDWHVRNASGTALEKAIDSNPSLFPVVVQIVSTEPKIVQVNANLYVERAQAHINSVKSGTVASIEQDIDSLNKTDEELKKSGEMYRDLSDDQKADARKQIAARRAIDQINLGKAIGDLTSTGGKAPDDHWGNLAGPQYYTITPSPSGSGVVLDPPPPVAPNGGIKIEN